MKKLIFLLFAIFVSFSVFAQIEDCVGAYPVCGNGDISLVPRGAGADDFANPNNYSPDCFMGGNGSKTTWLRLKIKQAGSLGFTIIPDDRVGEDRDDYDFAVYKSKNCNNLGRSIRCSTTNPQNAGVGADTGLSPNESETSEGPGADGNGFVRWLDDVRVGDVYYIFIDNFSQDKGYTLQWEGSALLEDRITKEEGGVDLGDDFNFCADETVVLDATIIGGVEYEWNTGDKNSTLTVTETGTYTVTATNSAGCISTDTINVVKLPVPEIETVAVTPNNICEPADVTFTAEGTAGKYEWFNLQETKVGEGKTLFLANQMASASGRYKVVLTRDNGCTDEKEVDLTIHPLPNLKTDGRIAYCETETIDLTVSGAQNYQWFSPSGQQISTTSTWQKSSAELSDEGEYSIIGTTTNGCIDTLKFQLIVEPELIVNAIEDAINVCTNEELVLQAEVNNSTATIEWLNAQNEQVGIGETLTLSNLSVEDSGTYQAVATNIIGCQDIDTIEIDVNQAYLFENEVTPCPGDFFTIPQTGEIVTDTRVVQVDLLTTELCDSTYVYDIKFFNCGEAICSAFPTSFAPNRNGYNDQFRPIFSPGCVPAEFILEIYNRWGQKVATITDATKGWDGTFNGEPAVRDLYTWKMIYVFPDNPEQEYVRTGAITLIR